MMKKEGGPIQYASTLFYVHLFKSTVNQETAGNTVKEIKAFIWVSEF